MNDYPLTPIDPLGLPASTEVLLVFKVLGFILHVIPMNIWYVGMPLSVVLVLFAKGNLQRIGFRLIYPMPILIALGINFGIVPLLFTQVMFYPQYYTAGILIAWPWLTVILLLMIAYYGVYIYSYQAKRQRLTRLGYTAGWISSLMFIVIGFLFANNFSLMTNPQQWIAIYQKTNVAGAVTGFALNLGDPTLFPRWLLMIGIAITTTAVWLLVDAEFFSFQESEHYRVYVPRFAFRLYTAGVIWMGIAGSWYILGTLPSEIFAKAMGQAWVKVFFGLAGFSALMPWLWILFKRNALNRRAMWIAVGLQLVVIVSNAISRQWVQIAEIGRFMPLTRDPVNWQWSAFIVFLFLLGSGLFVLAWMVKKITSLPRSEQASS